MNDPLALTICADQQFPLWLIYTDGFRLGFRLQTQWLHRAMQKFSHCKESDSDYNPNCQLQERDRNPSSYRVRLPPCKRAITLVPIPAHLNGSCALGTHDCDDNALCTDNNAVDYVCSCAPNYYGNGTRGNCHGEYPCFTLALRIGDIFLTYLQILLIFQSIYPHEIT